MPSRIYSRFPEQKITNPDPPADPRPGSKGTVTERTANWPGLPGPGSKGPKANVPKVKIYPSSQGLC